MLAGDEYCSPSMDQVETERIISTDAAMFNEIYTKDPDASVFAWSQSAVFRCIMSPMTIANPEYVFKFRISIINRSVYSSLMSFAGHLYIFGVVDE